MDNPNEYDEEGFIEACTNIQDELPHLLDLLWNAGASKLNIEEEIATALGSMDAEAFDDVRVEIHDITPGPAHSV